MTEIHNEKEAFPKTCRPRHNILRLIFYSAFGWEVTLFLVCMDAGQIFNSCQAGSNLSAD